MERALSNYFLGDPYRLAYNLTSMATRQGVGASPSQKLAMIKKISFEDIISFGKSWGKRFYIESLITGNLDQAQAKNIFS